MKNTRPTHAPLCAAFLPLAMGTANAATQTYLNTSPTNTWNTSDLNWDAGVVWTDSNDAVFAGTGEAVAVGTVTAHNLTFNSASYALNGGTITLAAATPTIAGSANATIDSVLAGTDGLTKSGGGVLTLNGANTYTGLTKVLGGAAYGTGLGSSLTLGAAAKINGNLQLGDGTTPGTVSILKMGAANQFATTSILDFQAGTAFTSGAELKLMGFSQTVAGLTSNVRADNVIENAETETGSGNSILTIDTGANNFTYTGVIRNSWNGGAMNGFGTVGITKKGSGTQTLSSSVANSAIVYRGNTSVEEGTLKLVDATQFRSATTTIASGAVLEWNNDANKASANPSSAISAVFNGAGTFRKTGAGIMMLSNGNLTSQINQPVGGQIDIQAGTLEFGFNHNAMGANLGSMNVSTGARYYNSDPNAAVDALTGGGTIGNAYSANVFTLTLGVSGTTNNAAFGVTGNTATFSGVIKDQETYNGVTTANTAVVKTGNGTQVFSGTNSYHGATTIKNGSLVLAGGDNRLLATGSVILGDAATTGKLVLGDTTAASNQTLAGISTTGLGGSVVGGNASTDSVLTFNIASGTSTIPATLGGAGANENKLALTKTGSGTLSVTGSHTFSGATTVSSGKLDLAGSLTNSALTVADDSTVSGEGSAASITLGSSLGGDLLATPSTAGALTAAGALTVNGQTLVDLAGTIPNPSFKVIQFGTNANGFTNANFDLANAGIYRPGYAFTVNANDVTLTLGKKSLEWTGNVDDGWDLGSTANFRDTTTLNPETFYSPDEVLFGNLPGADQNITLYGTLSPYRVTIDSQYNYTLGGTGSISGTAGLVKRGTGTATVANPNTYTGVTTVEGGRLAFASGAQQSFTGTNVTVASGGTLEWNLTTNQDLGPVNTVFSGAGVIQKTGAGILRIGNSGGDRQHSIQLSAGGVLDVQAGDLNIGWTNVCLNTNQGGLYLAAGAKLHNSQSAGMQFDWLSGSGDLNNAYNSTTPVITIGVAGTTNNATYGVSGNTATFSGRIGYAENYNSANVNTLSVVKTGAGTQVLAGTNGYTGSTTINGGTLALSNGAAIADAGAVILADAAGAQLLLNASETIGSLAGGGATGGNVNLQANTLTVGNASNTNFAGAISGTGGLTKVGAGTLTLSGSNSYSGNTTVSAGILSLSSAFLGNSSTVTVNGGVLNLNTGTNDTVGTLVLGVTTMGPGTYNATTHPTYFTGSGSLVIVGGNPYDTWTASKGLAGADALPDADPDKDGAANSVEFVLGGEPNPANPGSNSTALLPTVSQTATHLVFTFRRSDTANAMPGIIIGTEYGSTLTGWTTAQHGVNGVTIVTTDDGFAAGIDKVDVSIPKTLAVDSKLFVRLKVTLP